MARPSVRIALMRWHRRLGIVSALFVIVLAVTGLLLNHTHELGLDRAPVTSPALRALYGVAPAEDAAGLVHALPAGPLQVTGGQLRLDGRVIGDCPGLVGVVEQAGQVLAVCRNRLWLLTPDGQVIDQADGVRGVPEGLSAVASREGRVLLRHGERSLAVDLGDLSLKPADDTPGVAWPETAQPAAAADDIDWERVLLDLHSGRLLGPWGVWLMDAMAVLFVVLAVSGLVMARRRSPAA